MSVTYRAVGWNPQKRGYDLWIGAGIGGYLALFAAVHVVVQPHGTAETLVIRAFGSLALLLLHVILSIGPLVRLDPRLLPLLYNRRHLGVATCLVAAVHGVLATVQFHGFGDTPLLVSLLTTSRGWFTVSDFPFQLAGAAALLILVLMGATSHDFWLHVLTPPVWKRLHMLAYVAYGLLVVHVAFGAMQSERATAPTLLLSAGVAWIVGLHLIAARQEFRIDSAPPVRDRIEVCRAADIPDGRARVVAAGAERIAVFRNGCRISAISNVCQHQNGPLGEGRIVRGCVVCPWHGYEYAPESGAAPPPFTEKVATFRVELDGDRVFVDPRPYPPGTRLEPATWTGVQP